MCSTQRSSMSGVVPMPSSVSVPSSSVEDPASHSRLTARQFWVATWGVGGVLVLLAQAIWRLGGLALEALAMPLSAAQVAICVLWVVFNAYGEGYRAFQQRFSPRVVVRAHQLARNPQPLAVLLAPMYCMALLEAPRRTRVVAWLTVAMIMFFIVVLRQVSQPWRGIVDLGVTVALLWGTAAIVFFYVRALRSGKLPVIRSRPSRKHPPEPAQ